jgi:hypothetical protein
MDDFYGLGGQPVPHPDDMAARYGVSTRSLVDRIESIIKLMQLWIRTGYYGLPIPELYLVLRLGAEQPVQLPQLINSSANHRHWGPGRFQHINAWMIAHGYPSLIPHLDDAARARFKITG